MNIKATEFEQVFKKSEHQEVMEKLRELKKKLDEEFAKIDYPSVIPLDPCVPYVPPCCPYCNPCPRGRWVPCRRDCWGCPYAEKPYDYWLEYGHYWFWNDDDHNTTAMPMYPVDVVFTQHEVTV